jgi:DNA repair ATPase RecN
MTTLTLRHLCLTGPDKKPACVTFGHGLNVIYGASETGKSFIVEALDFMLGSSTELRDIPERVG